jgi:hypothetical protein
MLHDPRAYPEPFSFKPERFLASDGTFRDDPLLTSAFGFGRRLCPARHFVDSSLFIAVSCILAVFDVSPPKDEHGNELPVELRDSGTNSRYGRKGWLVLACGFPADAHLPCSRPLGFKCTIAPRDSRARELIIAANMAA